MKVLSFLEMMKKTLADKDIDFLYLKETLTRDIEFYSQPFKPELISKYFEGWNVISSSFIYGGYYSNNGVYVLSFINDIFSVEIIKSNDTDLISECIMPRTLDRFICHCQDAGIELVKVKE